MLNRFKSIFTPKKTKKQNLKYSPNEKKSPRSVNKENNVFFFLIISNNYHQIIIKLLIY